MTYQIIVDHFKVIPCLSYGDMMFKAWSYRLSGKHVQEIIISKKGVK
jgi:hypothetical protein